ncbi:MAG: tyrosine-type recombinase/integrase [Armatimonadetes bacterium]|nr:tyrosine-type recombinase/integrase [Armatimonadota bacterium]
MKKIRKRQRTARGPLPQDRIRYLSRETWDRFRSAVDRYRDQVMMDLLYSTGMRVGELVRSRIEDLDLSGGFLRIPSAHTKTRKPRTAVLPPAIRVQLKAYLKQEKRRSGPIFRSQKGGSLTVRQVQRLVRQYAGNASELPVDPPPRIESATSPGKPGRSSVLL